MSSTWKKVLLTGENVTVGTITANLPNDGTDITSGNSGTTFNMVTSSGAGGSAAALQIRTMNLGTAAFSASGDFVSSAGSASPTFANVTATGNLTVEGDFTVEGTTTSIQTTNLETVDKLIRLGVENSTDDTGDTFDGSYADSAQAVAANSGGGIQLVTDTNANESNWAKLTWVNDATSTTGWQIKNHGATNNDSSAGIAVMDISTSAAAPVNSTDYGGGVGSFFMGNTGALYFRTA